MTTTTIWERVVSALAPLGVPLAASQMLVGSGESLPDLYLVYFLIDSPPLQHADNAEQLRNQRMQVSAYSRRGLAVLPDIAGAMTAAGFTHGPDRELPFDPITRHYGLAMEFNYFKE